MDVIPGRLQLLPSMEPEDTNAADFQELLNEKLKKPRYDSYDVVRFLGLYWAEAEKSYRDESEDLKRYFARTFGYTDGVLFPIPSLHSHLELNSFVLSSIVDMNKQMRDRRSGLLIIHYGGHGDEDADEAKKQKRRSVWSALPDGGPTVQWYEIHPTLKRAEFDILLILDCCFAAQVGRSRKPRDERNTIVILAAAGMENRTPKPGSFSFTKTFMRQCDIMVQEQRPVLISELHQRLVNRKAELGTTPIIINPSPTTIKLQHIDDAMTIHAAADSRILLQIDAIDFVSGRQAFEERAESAAQWLNRNVPPWISNISVIGVAHTTKQSFRLVKDLVNLESEVPQVVGQSNKENFSQAWDHLVEVIFAHQDPEAEFSVDIVRERATSFLKRLDHANDQLLEAAADRIASSTTTEQSLTRSESESFELLKPIMLRRTIRRSEPVEMGLRVGESKFLEKPKLDEYKTYRAGLQSSDIEISKTRIEHLSGVLSSQKSLEYRSLPFASWNHEAANYRFVLSFDIPLEYDPSHWVSLHEAVETTKKSYRPTLTERLQLALAISIAVFKWHCAGWVHQGINSHDILLFNKHNQRRLDYSSPFLGGFEFSRPNLAPSLDQYVSDLDRDVYRHVERQGPSRIGHRKRHDLYSLGVVLLELGLWQQASDIANPRHLKDLGVGLMANNILAAADERLAFYVGQTYTQVVLRCLKNDFGVTVDDEAETNLDQATKFLIVDRLREGIRLE